MRWTIKAQCPKCGATMKMNLSQGLTPMMKDSIRDFVRDGYYSIQGHRIDAFSISEALTQCLECGTIWNVDAGVDSEKETVFVKKIYPSKYSLE